MLVGLSTPPPPRLRAVGRFTALVVIWQGHKAGNMRNVSRRARLMIAMAATAGRAFAPCVRAQRDRQAAQRFGAMIRCLISRPCTRNKVRLEFSFQFDDTTYWFASEEHRNTFAADPASRAAIQGISRPQRGEGPEDRGRPRSVDDLEWKAFVFGSRTRCRSSRPIPARSPTRRTRPGRRSRPMTSVIARPTAGRRRSSSAALRPEAASRSPWPRRLGACA